MEFSRDELEAGWRPSDAAWYSSSWVDRVRLRLRLRLRIPLLLLPPAAATSVVQQLQASQQASCRSTNLLYRNVPSLSRAEVALGASTKSTCVCYHPPDRGGARGAPQQLCDPPPTTAWVFSAPLRASSFRRASPLFSFSDPSPWSTPPPLPFAGETHRAALPHAHRPATSTSSVGIASSGGSVDVDRWFAITERILSAASMVLIGGGALPWYLSCFYREA